MQNTIKDKAIKAKTIKAEAKANLMPFLIFRKIKQCIAHGNQPIKNTKSSFRKAFIKDSKTKVLSFGNQDSKSAIF